MTPAHVGHWFVDLLYAAPLLVMLAVFVIARMRERAGRRDTDPGP